MTVTDISRILRGIVRELLGMPANSVRPANQSYATTGGQSEQFATVLITSISDEGWDDRVLINEPSPSLDVTEKMEGMRRMSVSVQFFRGDAYTKACRLRTLLGTANATEKLKKVGLGFIQASPAKNLTDVVDTFFEERGQVDLEFYLIAAEASVLRTYSHWKLSTTVFSTTIESEV